MNDLHEDADRDYMPEDDPEYTTDSKMNTAESTLQRMRERRSRGFPFSLLASPMSWLIAVAGLALIVIALAFVFWPDEKGNEGKNAAAAPAQATSTPAKVAAPPPTARPTQTVAPQERVHTVESGDTLSTIAEKYYGDSSKFTVIFEANSDILSNPDSLQLGQKLKIPN